MKNIIMLISLICLFISINSCTTDNIIKNDDNDGSITTFTLKSGNSTLRLNKTDEGNIYPKIQTNESEIFYYQPKSVICEIVTTDSSYWLHMPYQSIIENDNGSYSCSATLSTNEGSRIQVQDIYSSLDNDLFQVIRNVKILEVKASDIGFSTRFSMLRDTKSPLSDYDFFVPSIWYKDNAYVTNKSLASNYSDNDFWFREDRLPLPFIMLRDKKNGITFSISHKEPKGDTYKEENGLNRIIDERLQFASVGLSNNEHPEVGITYPGSEGERTYIYGSSTERRWAYRSHPMKQNFSQSYKIAFRLTKEDDYVSAMKDTWNTYYKMFSPTIYKSDLEEIYHQQINVLDKYWKSINNTAGVPFRLLLDGTIKSENDYNFNMGFVGHQPGNASLLIREGLKTKNESLLSKGEQMADFWANNCVTTNGCPKTWYDPYPKTWRGPEVGLREIGDGMIGLLRAWNYERMYNRDKPRWLEACTKVADWIVTSQLSNGSFYSHYDYNTGLSTRQYTNCTSHIIPYLTEMYLATGKDEYKKAALKAGEFIYSDIMNNFRYVGGAIDNPNVMDKEAASMALRAFLALYDLQNEQKWLDAMVQTAYFYSSWVVCWNIPIPKDDTESVFPANRSVIGQSLIATGHSSADTYAAIDAMAFYRVYLYSGDKQLLHFSKLLLNNTKQFMNWNSKDPIPWIAKGLFGEAMNVSVPRGHGVNYYLPWATYNQLEPIVLLEDIFGYKQIEDIESLSSIDKANKHRNYSRSRLYSR